MADIGVAIKHPTNGAIINVDLDDQMTCREIVQHLINNDFVASGDWGISMNKSTGSVVQLQMDQSLAAQGVVDGIKLLVYSATDAGGRVFY